MVNTMIEARGVDLAAFPPPSVEPLLTGDHPSLAPRALASFRNLGINTFRLDGCANIATPAETSSTTTTPSRSMASNNQHQSEHNGTTPVPGQWVHPIGSFDPSSQGG
jgi:hypothetical protein